MKHKFALMLLTVISVFAFVFGCAGCAGIGISSCTGTSENEHVHSYASSWSYDEVYHWHAAMCEHKDLGSDTEEQTF